MAESSTGNELPASDSSSPIDSLSNDAKAYTIYFNPGTSVSEVKTYVAALPDRGKGKEDWRFENPQYATTLTDAEANERRNDKIVFTILPKERRRLYWARAPNFKRADTPSRAHGDLYRRDPSTVPLNLISKAKDHEESKEFNSYLFHPSRGAGTTIYFVDSGINKNHVEFKDRGAGVETTGWCVSRSYTGGDKPDTGDDALTDYAMWNNRIGEYLGHGTGVASLAAGKNLGVASRANIVMVKAAGGITTYNRLPLPPVDEVHATDDGYRSLLKKIIQDIETKGLRRKAVVNLSVVSPWRPDPKGHDELEQIFDEFLTECEKNEVLVVSAAGNWGNKWQHKQGGGPEKDEVIVSGRTGRFRTQGKPWTREYDLPARLMPKHPNALLSVGATNLDGSLWVSTTPPDKNSQYPISVFAPGNEIKKACPYSNTATTMRPGTSYATGFVSGLAAYIMGLPDDITHLANSENFLQDLGNIIKSDAWQRVKDPRDFDFPIERLNYHEWFPDTLPTIYNGAWKG